MHAKVKGSLGRGAMSILEDRTIVSVFWKGLTNKAPWTLEVCSTCLPCLIAVLACCFCVLCSPERLYKAPKDCTKT